jgi:hypothetical protein
MSARIGKEQIKRCIYNNEFLVVNKDTVLTVAIITGLFGGLIVGPITSLVYYDASPEERFNLFIIRDCRFYLHTQTLRTLWLIITVSYSR